MLKPQAGWQASMLLKAWDDYVTACQGVMQRIQDPNANPGAAMSLPFFGAWQEFAQALGMRADVLAVDGLKPEDVMAQFMPALGHTREYQTTLQRMLELGSQFQRRYAEFMQHGADIGQRALQAMQKRSAADSSLSSSPAAAYEAWIDCAEQTYAQAAHGEPFARALGELCNLLSAFKVERGKLLEAFARHLDLPSRAEVDSLHRQVHELTAALHEVTSRARQPGPKRRKARKPAGK
jgi:class III poly(R)-hydroxyalkanoic acid synthase PhaE subunit